MLDHDIADRLAARLGLAPVAGTGSAQNGDWIDTREYDSVFGVVCYSTSGGVTGGTISVKLQSAYDASGTGATDFDTPTLHTIPAGPNAKGVIKHARDTRGAKRFVRLVVDSDPTGGTPASTVAAALVLGNPRNLPAV